MAGTGDEHGGGLGGKVMSGNGMEMEEALSLGDSPLQEDRNLCLLCFLVFPWGLEGQHTAVGTQWMFAK